MIKQTPTETLTNRTRNRISAIMREIPISCCGSDDKLAHPYGDLAIPKQTEKVKTQTPFHPDIPINAGIRRTIALSHCPRAENINGHCDPEHKEYGLG